MKKIALLGLLVAALILPGCNHASKAARRADGSKYRVQFIVNANTNNSMSETQVRAQKQLQGWMENDLLRLLTRAGYQAEPINKVSQFSGGGGNYLINIKIVNYNPGSKAARMLVGFGAGSTSLDINYKILNGHKKQLVDKDDGVGSSRDWTYCARVLNERIIATLGMNVGK